MWSEARCLLYFKMGTITACLHSGGTGPVERGEIFQVTEKAPEARKVTSITHGSLAMLMLSK